MLFENYNFRHLVAILLLLISDWNALVFADAETKTLKKISCCCCDKDYNGSARTSVPDEQRLMQYLLHGYEQSVRPVFDSSRPVFAKLGITLNQIFDMDEKNQVLVTNVWLDQEWHDDFLTWKPAQFSNQLKIRLPSEKIWKPDIVLYNNAADFSDNLMPALAMIESNGKVFWPVPVKFRSSCKVDVTYFPFDEQVCNLKFGSWTYDGFQVDLLLRSDDVDTNAYVPNGEWQLLGTRAIRNVIRYPCCDEPYPDVTFYLFLRRRLLYYMYNVIYPCIMMSTLTLLVFCLPPDSGEKIALGITVLLAFSVLMLSIADRLPETSESVPIISIYLTVVMSMTSVSVILTVFVLNLHHRGPSKKQVPGWIKRLVFGRNRADHFMPDELTQTTDFIRNISLKFTVESLAKGLQQEQEDQQQQPLSDEIDSATSTTYSPHNHVGTNGSSNRIYKPLRPHVIPSKATDNNPTVKTNKDILGALKKIIEKHDADDSESRLIAEWREVAQFVDKLLFWIYLLCSLASTVIILVIAPVYRIIPHHTLNPVAQNDYFNFTDYNNNTTISLVVSPFNDTEV